MKDFVRGQKSRIADLTSALSSIAVGVGLNFSNPQVVQICCFGVTDTNTLLNERYFIFDQQRKTPEGGVLAIGQRGHDTEQFRIDLARMPQMLNKLIFTATIEDSATMGQLSKGHLRILANQQEVARYFFEGKEFGNEKSVIIAELFLTDVWRFGAIGQGFGGDLKGLIRHFKGEEAILALPSPS